MACRDTHRSTRGHDVSVKFLLCSDSLLVVVPQGEAHDLENLNGGPCWTSAGDFHCRLPQGRRIVWDYVQQAEDRLQFMSRRLPAIQSLGAHSAPFQAELDKICTTT